MCSLLFTMFYDAMIFWVVSKVLLCSFLGMLGGCQGVDKQF